MLPSIYVAVEWNESYKSNYKCPHIYSGRTGMNEQGVLGDDTVALDRDMALEEVLDLQMSECLRKKLREPDEYHKMDASLSNDADEFAGGFSTEAHLARVSRPSSLSKQECNMDRPESLLEDILAAAVPRLASSARQDMDCY